MVTERALDTEIRRDIYEVLIQAGDRGLTPRSVASGLQQVGDWFIFEREITSILDSLVAKGALGVRGGRYYAIEGAR